jgi:hypothetical protein
MSTAPPGGNGQISLIGLEGEKVWAWAAAVRAANSSASPARIGELDEFSILREKALKRTVRHLV